MLKLAIKSAFVVSLVTSTLSACSGGSAKKVEVGDSAKKPTIAPIATYTPAPTSNDSTVFTPQPDVPTATPLAIATVIGGVQTTQPVIIPTPAPTVDPNLGNGNGGGGNNGGGGSSQQPQATTDVTLTVTLSGTASITPTPMPTTTGPTTSGQPQQPTNQEVMPTQFGELQLTAPAGWSVGQQAVNSLGSVSTGSSSATSGQAAPGADTPVSILGLTQGDKYVTIYHKTGTGLTMQALFVNGAQVLVAEHTQKIGAYDWRLIETTKTVASGLPMAGTYYTTGFLLEKNGQSYYGYSRAQDAASAKAQVEEVLKAFQ